ncbi:MAG: hypothetical protein Q9184_006820, partial [Pyrenodesmia sp. 2 TL-2023]
MSINNGRDMSSFDLSTPPSKKRRIITIYGSQGKLSRVWRAVKDAVPISLISGNQHGNQAGNQDPVSSTDELNESHMPMPPKDTKHLDDTARKEHVSHGMNGLSPDVAECESNGHGGQQDQSAGRRTSKRLRDRPENPDITPSTTRRRKYKTHAHAHAHAHPDVVALNQVQDLKGGVRNVMRRSSRSQKTPQSSHNQQDAGVGSDGLSDGSAPDINGELSSERLRKIPRLLPQEMEHRSSVKSTPMKAVTPKTPFSTPGRKRGRPSKHASIIPAGHHPEETELGFREIPIKEQPSVHGRNHLQRGTGSVSNKRLS